MRIFQVITASEYGGAQTVVANLVKALSPEHEVFILYCGNGEAWSGLGNNFKRIKLASNRKSISFSDIFLFLKLFYYRLKYKPDIVHLHSSKMGVLGRIAFNPKKTILTMHGFDSVRKGYPAFRRIESILKNRAFRIIGVSQYDVDCMKEEGIYKNVECIYNGVIDHSILQEKLQNDITLELERIKSLYSKIIMCISRISKQKKFDLFIDIAQAMPQHAFVWIGNKEQVTGLPDNVFCLGQAHAAFFYLKFANIFILPSNYEGLPMSILEALSFSVPVVASAVGGIPEILDGKNGFAVENTVKAFTSKIDYIFSDEIIEKNISDQARKSFLDNFTVQKMIDSYLILFNKVLTNKPK